jgi:regulator of protease activity HflC (stomatin/prohibitin superfamily)
MSRTHGPLMSPDDPFQPGGEVSGAPRRAGSVSFQREGGVADEASMLDPANQSLADALRVMMGLLQLAMLVLAGLYLLSGIQTVREGERGIRLLFGAKQATNLEPGASWSAPYPLGELIKVNQGEQRLELSRDFWQYVEQGGDPSADKLPMKDSLKPFEGDSGSILTADGNIAHAKWRMTYSRRDVAMFAENIGDRRQQEEALVRAAARRGVVHACAQVNIEDLLTQSGGQPGSVAHTAQRIAQETLDRAQSGLKIDTLDLLQTIPPSYVRNDFAKVQSAASDARRAVENAGAEASQTLLAAAGEAAPYLIRHMDLYEAATTRRNAALAAGSADEARRAEADMSRLLTEIDALLQGQPVEVPAGEITVAGTTRPLPGGVVQNLAGGKVSDTLAAARSYRTGVVSRARTNLRRFEARLAQFNANPGVTIHREWAEAVRTFMGRDSVQVFLLPPNLGTLNLQLNEDPEITRALQREQKAREREEAEHKRMQEFEKTKFKTETGVQPIAG